MISHSADLGPTDFSEASTVLETHISSLWFVGDRVLKLKKPVEFGFLDFSTRELRAAAVHREIDLNRRLSPDVYLGVIDFVDESGVAIDHAVAMRRMPASRCLAMLVQEGNPEVPEILEALARLLADFHARADQSEDINQSATQADVASNWEDNFASLEPFIGLVVDRDVADRVQSLAIRYLEGREHLFDDRISDGHICDGHGDLQAADIYCLADGPRVLDCIEFNDRFRYGDVLADIAFLIMDIERLGAPRLAADFLTAYNEFSGEVAPQSLLHHYVAYRAHVRCKVACLRAAQEVGASRQRSVDEAQSLMALALQHLETARVRLILVGGSPGTGKSTVSAGIADALNCAVLRSDEVRKELLGVDSATSQADVWQSGPYSSSMTEQVYAQVLQRAEIALARGESVVVDATFNSDQQRQGARDLAARTISDLQEIRCVLPIDIAVERILLRSATDASDADEDVARRMTAAFEGWPEAAEISTLGSRAEIAEAARALVVEQGLPAHPNPDVR